ncbi:MFS transporter [Nocardia sp. NBC_00565]|uniref:MFS transporter n=1 Tax=Nocardia sp. NBC_00565 TaxID=2975993 RepID=UPI002E803FE6|nr:MFS transporter [Nocardia sp. NBC_00565]WUC03938.1 MFS transporter [Nocardia sp. NBC_00565]
MTEVSARIAPPQAAKTAVRTLVIACGAAFIAFLDLSVVNIAFPSIARDFPDTATTTLTWVVSGYAIAFAALLTPAGRFADTLGRRRLFLIALAGFALTSLLCGLAPTAGWLIAGRLLQGGTAALMVPSALGLVLSVTPREKIGAAIGAWSAAGGFAAVVGPAIGGALVESFGWRAVFVINIPVALALIVPGLRIPVPDTRQPGSALPDPLGTVAIALGLGGLVAGVTEGQRWGWTAPGTLAALGVGALLVLAALIRSARHHNPAIAVELWQSSPYALANAASFVFGATMFAWLLAGPLFLDAIWHYSVLGSAAALTVGAVSSMVTATIAGRVTAPTARRWIGVLGALMYTGTTLWMSTFGPTPALWSAWIPAGLLGGGGVGIVVTVLGTAAASSLPPQRFAAGIGMNLTARQVGGALGVAVLAAVFAANTDDALTAFHTLFAVCAGIGAVAALVMAIPARIPVPAVAVPAQS